jgi:hypothetical protein
LFGDFTGTVDLGLGPLARAGTRDLFVAKYAETLEPIWTRAFGDAHPQTAGAGSSIAVDALGRAHITGEFAGTIDFGRGPVTALGYHDAFLAKIDP